MENLNLLKMVFQKHYSYALFVLFLSIIFSLRNPVYAQVSPVIQWSNQINHLPLNSTNPLQNCTSTTGNTLDWCFQNKQAKDGTGYISCGWTTRYQTDGAGH